MESQELIRVATISSNDWIMTAGWWKMSVRYQVDFAMRLWDMDELLVFSHTVAVAQVSMAV